MRRLFIVLLILLGSSALFWSKENTSPLLDEAIQRTIDYPDRVRSYTVRIEDYDAQGKRRADINYVVDGSNWIMKSAAANDTIFTIFEWRKIGEDLFVLNADTGWFWKIPYSTMPLPGRVDVRDAIREIQNALERKKLRVTRIGSEPCGEHLCWRFRLIDPSSQIVERYWWIDASEFRLMKDQFVIGNGEASIATYDYEKEIEVEKPIQTKDVPSGMDVMTLPGIVRNPLTPKPLKLQTSQTFQKSV